MKLNRVEQIVYDLLTKENRPLSAYDILNFVKDDKIKSPTIVYRALKKLSSLYLVHRLEALNSYISCKNKCKSHQHHFFICEKCNDVFEDSNGKLNDAINNISKQHSFTVERSVVEIFGQCENCYKINN